MSADALAQPRYVLKIPDCEPVAIDGWEKMDVAERKVALCFATAKALGVAAGLDLMTLQHQELCQSAPHLAPLAERFWPAARRAFVLECAKNGYVRSDRDRATLATEGGATS